MKTISSLAIFALGVTTSVAAESNFYFEAVSGNSREYFALSVKDSYLVGTYSQDSESGHATGTLAGEYGKDHIYHAIYSYSIEGNAMTEQIEFKISRDQLLMGVGELTETSPNEMVLKDPSKVQFTKILQQVPLASWDPASAEWKAIVTPLEETISKSVGGPVLVDVGVVRATDDWAMYDGLLKLADGAKLEPSLAKKVTDSRVRAFLRRKGDGPWTTDRWGFMDENGAIDYQGATEPPPPWQLEESLELDTLNQGD